MSFEQQKELLLLTFEQEKLCRNTEREEKLDIERLRQAERFELERMRQNEKRKLEMEHPQVQLIREGNVSIGSAAEIGGSLGVAPGNFDVAAKLRLVTKFYERDPDAFFTLFERAAVRDRILMFQCVLTGRAQEAYLAECGEDNLDYEAVKSAVLKSYELVPQKLRNWAKGDKQTNVEFVRDLTSHFPQHCKNPTAELPRSGVCQEDGCSELAKLL